VMAGADHRDARRHVPLLDISPRYPLGVVGESPNVLVSNETLANPHVAAGRW
jgi:hypothetical protein